MPKDTCSIEGCERPCRARGLCAMHYKRWRAHGDPLKGKPRGSRLDPAERFWAKVNKDGPIPEHRPELGPCWVWTGAQDGKGYGHFGIGGRSGPTIKVYRFAYELLIGRVPDGLELDHLCRNRLCANPYHLEPVTHAENKRRCALIKTCCIHGHPYTPENTHWYKGTRFCRACMSRRSQEACRRKRERTC